ncbi:MAG: NADH:flavin oxidoreductase [Candidatus Riflebacteria bacterium]|nr:NADH:flavin oxidoreductase [Candidatus Riflebacteria bacterium]
MSMLAFTPFQLRNVTLKNRFLLAPMATQYVEKGGIIGDSLIDYYIHMALTGVAAVIVEAAAIATEGRGWSRQLSAASPNDLPGLSHIAEAIRERGSIPLLQIHHAGRQGLPADASGYVVGPSGIPCPVLGRPVRVLNPKDIKTLVTKFTDAARIAERAGFAGIELHGAHGYLLHQFVSPLTNKRDDEYGLKNPNPYRFPLEVVKSIRMAVPDMILAYRLSARDYLPRGLTLEHSVPLAIALADAGVDMLHVSGGMYASLHGPESIVGPSTPSGVFRSDAHDIRQAVRVPVAVVGKIQTPALAEEILQNSDAHLIALGRILLRDPLWIQKAQGQSDVPVRPCLLCSRCRYHLKGCPDDQQKPIWVK